MKLSDLLGHRFWEQQLADRLGEPLHLNLASLFVKLFGGFRAKVAFDLIERRRYAMPLLKAADYAKAQGVPKIYVLEFGIAAGAGLVNLAWLAERVTAETGVEIGIVGFDAGTGMPPPADYRDYPEEFVAGDFPLPDPAALEKVLPKSVRVIYGPVAETTRSLIDTLDAPVGFAVMDLAYYSSTIEAMTVLEGPPERYLPMTLVYLGAIRIDNANPAVGELAAVRDFNARHELRQIHPFTTLRDKRVFRRAAWLEQIHTLHVLDHPRRSGRDPLVRPVWALAGPGGGAARG
jgi:hypothetical protein